MSASSAAEIPATGIPRITDLLPHRYPFLMIDRVVALEPGRNCRAIKRLTLGDPLIGEALGGAGPALSPLLFVEGLSQTAGLAAVEGRHGVSVKPAVAFLAAIRDFIVTGTARPGQTLEFSVELAGRFGRMVKARGTVSVEGKPLATAELILTVPEGVTVGNEQPSD